MFIKKYFKTVCVDKERVAYEYKNLKTLRMVLGCYVLGEACLMEFPYTVHEHKASIEVIPAVILLNIFLSIPLTFTFLGLSQYSNRGWTKIWDFQPGWRGISIAGLICLYISIVLNFFLCSKFLFYAIRSLETHTPWSRCPSDQPFQTAACYTYRENRSIYMDCIDMRGEEHCSRLPWKNSAQYFWDHYMRAKHMKRTYYNGILFPYQVTVYFMVYIFIRNSAKTVGLFSPFLLILPTILHGLVLIRSFLHPGTLRGLNAMFNFKFANLFSKTFWIDFAFVYLYSTGFAYGGLSNIGKNYNFRNPIKVDAVFVNVGFTTYSILYSILLYNMFGILSYELNIPFETIHDSDNEHIFVQFALSISYLKPVKFWTFAFYIANFFVVFRTLGVDVEVFMNNVFELYPNLVHYMIPAAIVFSNANLAVCLIMNFKGLYDVLKKFLVMMRWGIVPVLAFYIHIALSVLYGVTRLIDDMHFMLGFRPSSNVIMNWYLSPLIFLFFPVYTTSYFFTINWDVASIKVVFSFFASFAISLIPLIYFIIFVIVKRRQNIPYLEIVQPTKTWGPRDELLRKSREMFSAHDMTKEYLYRQKKLRTNRSKSRAGLGLSVSSM